jgi:hypothetical protein
MNQNNSITITFKVQLDEVTQTIESVLPYHGDFETLEKLYPKRTYLCID